MSKFFIRLNRNISKNIWPFRIIFFLILGVLIFASVQLHLTENVDDLIPRKKQNEELQKVLNHIQFRDQYVLKFERNDEQTLDKLTTSAQQFLDSLQPLIGEYINNIQGKVTDEEAEAFLELALQNMPLYLKADDYKRLDKLINQDSIDVITQRNYNNVISSSGVMLKRIVPRDPLGISFMGLKNIREHSFNKTFEIKDNFLVSPDEKQLLLIITPKDDLSPESLNVISSKLLLLEKTFEEKNPEIDISMLGGPLIAKGNADRIKGDIFKTVGIAMTLLILLLILYYRKIYMPALLLIPTAVGGLIGLTILFLLKQEISAISLGIGAILLGITIDFSLHIATHLKKDPSISRLYETTATPIILSSLTTSLAFLCLILIDSPALNDLGLFTSISVFATAIFALIFIPLAYKPTIVAEASNAVLKLRFIERIASYNYHKNKFLVGFIVLVLLLSVFFYGRVQFNNDLSKLNYMTPELARAEKELDAITLAGSKSLYAVSYNENFQNALNTNEKVNTQLEKLKAEGIIESYTSIAPLLSSDSLQKLQIAKWKEFWTLSKIDNLAAYLDKSASKVGFKLNSFQPFLENIQNNTEIIELQDYQELPFLAINNFIVNDKDLSTVTTIIKVKDDKINTTLSEFKDIPSLIIIDRQKLNEDLLGHLKTEFNNLLLYCSIAIAILLMLFYRNIKLTVITLLPIIITWIITIGLMGMFQLEFNVFNIIISSFVFGLGVDYSIFITNGLVMKHNEKAEEIITSKVAILLSVITTLTGVGVMIFAKHPALHSISLVCIIGIFSAVLVSFTIQPIAFKLLIKKQNGEN